MNRQHGSRNQDSLAGYCARDIIRAIDLLDAQLFIDFSLQSEIENARRGDRLRQADDFRVERKVLLDLVIGGYPGAGKRGF